MDPNVARFRAFLREAVSPFVRSRGFRGTGQRFRAPRDDNALMIAFQRRGEFFTCDLGVISGHLAATAPPFWDPPEHYRVRLGPITVGYDKWWDLTELSETLTADFLSALGKGLDYIEDLSTDEGLRAAILRDVARDPDGPRPFEASMLRRLGHPGGATT